MVAVLLLVLFSGFLAPAICKSSTSNPASELSTAINQNRTNSKLSSLYDNAGLACIALQYIQAFQGACNEVGKEKPSSSDIKSDFATNCGVDPNTVSTITGTVLACESVYKDASYAFSNLLFHESKTLSILTNTNHTEFGTGISGSDGGSPYFWCVMFSNGSPPNSTFKFTTGTALAQKTGCFSGTSDPCSSALTIRQATSWIISISLFSVAFILRM